MEITTMKRAYVKPTMESEAFVPQTYVAACGDENKVYKFVCNANPGGWFEVGGVYEETNGKEGLQLIGSNPDRRLSFLSYHPCSETHYAPVDDEFIHGYLVGVDIPPKVTEVMIWTDGGTNVHCTTDLKQETWETYKS